MPDETSARAMNPGGVTNGASLGAQRPTEGMPPLAINKRLPRGRKLPDYAIEYFNQLVAQYVNLPAVEGNTQNAKMIAEGLIAEQANAEQANAEQANAGRRGIRWLWGREFRWPWEREFRWHWEPKEHDLNWGDVSGMEMAVLQLLPEAYLQRYAWNLRARYHEVAGQCWYDFYQQSKPPSGMAPPEKGGAATVSVTRIPLGASGVFLLTPTTPEPPANDDPGDTPAAVELRADLSILLSDLQRLRSTIMAREDKHSKISLIGALLAAVSLTLALLFYGGPSLYAEWAAKQAVPARAAIAAVPAPAASVPPKNSPGNPAVPTNPKPATGTPPPAAAPPAPASSPLRILQMAALVILCGVLGGLISMLRRLQALPPGSTPLFDTIALNAGQFGIGLAPIYGGIFAMVLYLVFLSGVLDTVIASTAGDIVFPHFTDATPKTTPDYARLLIWAFMAGFAEQLVPDVLNRLTARNTAALAKPAGASGTAPPSRPA